MPQNWDETVDFLVVGSGGGSMCAGLMLRHLGKTPLILEKTDKIGGSTAMSGGVLWIPNNPLMRREGVADTPDAARTYFDAAVGHDAAPGASPARRDAFLRAGPRMTEFLEAKGVQFERADGWSDYYDDLPGGCPRGRSIGMKLLDSAEMGSLLDDLRIGPMPFPVSANEIRDISLATRTLSGMAMGIKVLLRMRRGKRTGKPLLGVGAAVQGRMLMAAAAHGVPIRTSHAVRQLLAEDGRVVGVLAEHAGRTLRIRARDGVLINAGGFSHNLAMRQKYGPAPASVDFTNANPGDTGEMIEQAQALGAAIDLMDEAWWVPGTKPPNGEIYMHVSDIAKPHVILVNGAAQRFTNEAGSYMQNGQRMYEQHPPVWWVIMESRHRRRYAWGTQPPGVTPPDWVGSGYMKKADSLAALASQIGLDATALAATVARFNGFCAHGKDEDFNRGGRAYDRFYADPRNKPNASLGALEKPPFYAFKAFPGDVGTSGGIVCDEWARVLRDDGSVIPGLYATGNSTAAVTGRCYPGAGASIAASFVFGYLAARHAAGVLDNS